MTRAAALTLAARLLADMEAKDAVQAGVKDSKKQHTKVCPKCGRTLLLGELHANPKTPTGRACWCKACYRDVYRQKIGK